MKNPPPIPLTQLFALFFAELLKKGIVLKEFSVDHLDALMSVFHDEGQKVLKLLSNEEAVLYFPEHEVMIRENRWRVNYCHDPLLREDYFYRWRPAFEFIKKRFPESPYGAEIGVFEGFLSTLVLKFLKPRKYVLIDPWREYNDIISDKIYRLRQDVWEDVYREVCDRFKNNSEVEIIRNPSTEAAKGFPDEIFDFVYIDADHRAKSVYEDMEVWYPKVKSGGILAGHDWEEIGVSSGVYSFLYDKFYIMEKEQNFYSSNNDWWFIKP